MEGMTGRTDGDLGFLAYGLMGTLDFLLTCPHMLPLESIKRQGPALAQNNLLRTISGMWQQNSFP